MFLCSGEKKHSFLGTLFHRNSWKGLPGHHIWSGDFYNSDGSHGKCILKPKDGHFDANPTNVPITKGLVAARNGFDDISSIFKIYIKGCSKGIENGAFGEVIEGFQYLEYLSNLDDISSAYIYDCGNVITL